MADHEAEYPGDRGFAHFEKTKTDYGAEVHFSESSSAEKPAIWMRAKQPELGPSPPYLAPFDASVHMTLPQAVEIQEKLTAAIEYTKKSWGIGESLDDYLKWVELRHELDNLTEEAGWHIRKLGQNKATDADCEEQEERIKRMAEVKSEMDKLRPTAFNDERK